MKLTPKTDTEAQRLTRRKLLTTGWHIGRITQAIETTSKADNPMIELNVSVMSTDDNEHILRDWLLDNNRSALKLRHAAEAVGALTKYQAGNIDATDFENREVRIKVSVERKRGFPDANKIDDYGAAEAGRMVSNLRRVG